MTMSRSALENRTITAGHELLDIVIESDFNLGSSHETGRAFICS